MRDARTWLLTLLRYLEQAIPPPKGAHHAISHGAYGSDADGWTEKLCLHILLAGAKHERFRHQTFFLDDGDFEKAPEVLVAEIKAELTGLV